MSELTHLSYSSVRQYMDCGLQFKFRKVDQLEPEHTSEALVFGLCVHKALAKFHQQRSENKPVNASELADWFEGYFTGAVQNTPKIKYSNGNDFQSCLTQGKKLLEVFHQSLPQESQCSVLDIEKEFRLEIEDIPYPIIGYIDLVETDEEGNVLLTEYKTASKAYSTPQIDLNEQVTLYHMALQNIYPEKQVMVKIDCLIKTKTPKFEQYYSYRDIDDHHRLIKTLTQVAKGIKAGVFIPNTSSWKCAYCEYKKACHEWLTS